MGFPVQPRQFKSWSNSRWNDYSQCPLRAKLKHLDKLPEPKSPQMDRGIFIAKQEEDYFLGKVSKIPPDIHKDLHPEFRRIKKVGQKRLLVEQNWGFDKNWKQVDYFDWDNCWLRVKVDVGYTDGTKVHLYDNKTGGVDKSTGGLRLSDREKYEEQLDLYRAAGIAQFPDATEFHTKLIYTDIGITFPATAMVSSAADALKAQKAWSKKVVPMFADKRFLPRPGFYCRWCHYRKANGGPCKY
jgi:hypothetical protein